MIQLHHGDCLEIMKSMQDNEVDLIVTDPPYGKGLSKNKNIGFGHTDKNQKWKNRKRTEFSVSDWDDKIPDPEYFSEMVRVSRNQVIFGGNYFAHLLPPSSGWIVWNKLNNGNFADCELAWTSFNKPIRKIDYLWDGFRQGNIKNKEKRVHPTQKPVPVIEWIIENYSNQDDIIGDFFMGSGTTGVAAMNLNHDFIGCEREDIYFPISKNRIESASKQLSF